MINFLFFTTEVTVLTYPPLYLVSVLSQNEVSLDIFLDETTLGMVAYSHIAIECAWGGLQTTWIKVIMNPWRIFDDPAHKIISKAPVFSLIILRLV